MKKIKIRYFVLMACLALVILASGCIKTDPRTKPGAPSNLVGKAISHREVQLTWQDNSDNEDGFRVACNIYGGDKYYEIGDLPANTTSFAHSELDPLETYRYYVQAYNDIGEANSNTIEVITLSGVTILDYSLGEKWGDAWVTGHARNDTDEMLTLATITVWFYDAGGIMLDSEDDIAFDIPPLTTWEFDCWAITLERSRVDHIVVEITNVIIFSSSEKENGKEMGPESEWGLSGR